MTLESTTTYPYTFTWPHGGESVAVAGTFDEPLQNWTPVTMHLNSATGLHEVTLPLLPNKTFRYKFVVDGEWKTDQAREVLTDEEGNVNHEVILRTKEGDGNVVEIEEVKKEVGQNGEEIITTTTTTTTTTMGPEEVFDVQEIEAGTAIEESTDIAVEPTSIHQANVQHVETTQAEEEVVEVQEMGAAEIVLEQAEAPIDAVEITAESAPAHQHVFEPAEEVIDVQEVQAVDVPLQQEQAPIDTSEIIVESLAATAAAGKVIGVAELSNNNVLTVDESFIVQGPIDSDQIVVESLASHGVHVQMTETGLVETLTTTLVSEDAEPDQLGVPEQDTEVLASIDGPIEAGIIDSGEVKEIVRHEEQVQELLVEQEQQQQQIEEPVATVATMVDTVTPELDVNDVMVQEAHVLEGTEPDQLEVPEEDTEVLASIDGPIEAGIIDSGEVKEIVRHEEQVQELLVEQEQQQIEEPAATVTATVDTVTPELDVNGVMVQEAHVLEDTEPDQLEVPEEDTEVLASIDGPIEAGIINSGEVKEIVRHEEQVQELLVEQEQQQIEEPAATTTVDIVTPELDVNDVMVQEAHVVEQEQQQIEEPAATVMATAMGDIVTPELDVNGVMVQEAHVVEQEQQQIEEPAAAATAMGDTVTPELDVNGVMVQEAHVVHGVAADEHGIAANEHDIDEKLTPPQFEAPQEAHALQADVLVEAAAVMAAAGALAETEQAQVSIQRPLRSPQVEEEAFLEEIPVHEERHLVHSDVAKEITTAATAKHGVSIELEEGEEGAEPSQSSVEVEGINERIEVEAGRTQAEQEDYARVMSEAMLTASMTAAAIVAGVPPTGHAAHKETKQVLVDAGNAQQVTATGFQASTELQDEATISPSILVEDTVAVVPNSAFLKSTTTLENVSEVESVSSIILDGTRVTAPVIESQKPNELDQVVPEVLVRETIVMSMDGTFGDDTDTAVFEQRRTLGTEEEVTLEKMDSVITLTEGTTTITSTKIVTVTQETVLHGGTGKREYFVAEDVVDAQTGEEDLVIVETTTAAEAAFVASQIAHDIAAEKLPATVLTQRKVTVRSDEDADEVLVLEEVSASKVSASKAVNETVPQDKAERTTSNGLLVGGILLVVMGVGVVVYQSFIKN